MSKKSGLTLMEMMVVLVVFSIVMGIAYTALRLNDTYRDLILVKIELYRKCKQAADSLIEELQRSTFTDNRVVINYGTGNNADSILFQIPWIDGSYVTHWGAGAGFPDNYWISYSLNTVNNHLERDILDNTIPTPSSTINVSIVATNITNLQFCSDPGTCDPDTNYITIDIEAQKDTLPPVHTISSRLEGSVYLLN